MHVALTGASGFIGSVTARHLVAAGHEVSALVRKTSRRDHIEPFVTRFVVGDQVDRDAWDELLELADCVIHASVDWQALREDDGQEARPTTSPTGYLRHLQSNLIGSLELLRRARRGREKPRQFIFLSTVAVHHDIRPRERNERGQGVVDPDHPMRPGTAYGAYKAAVESHLWFEHFSSGQNTSAVRPSAVYGIDPRLDRSVGYRIIQKVAKDRRFDKPGGGKFVHVEDVAAVLTRLVGNDVAAGNVYDMADCYARHGDMAEMAAEALGIDAEIDNSSPPAPKNVFTKEAVQFLGVEMSRGHDGLREHIRELAGAMRGAGAL